MTLICLKCKNKMEKEGNFCSQCGAKMSIYGLQVNVSIGGSGEHKAVPEEETILNNFIDTLDVPKEDFKIEKKSDNYTTLVYKDRDLIRLKYTDLAKWVEVIVVRDMKKKYLDSPLFEENTKSKVFWKSILKDKDLTPYKEIIEYYINEVV